MQVGRAAGPEVSTRATEQRRQLHRAGGGRPRGV